MRALIALVLVLVPAMRVAAQAPPRRDARDQTSVAVESVTGRDTLDALLPALEDAVAGCRAQGRRARGRELGIDAHVALTFDAEGHARATIASTETETRSALVRGWRACVLRRITRVPFGAGAAGGAALVVRQQAALALLAPGTDPREGDGLPSLADQGARLAETRGRVTVGGVTTDGTPAMARRVALTHVSELRACYGRTLADHPDTSGQVRLALTTTESGEVTGASAEENTTGQEELAACLVRMARRWSFVGAHATSVGIVVELAPSP